MLLQSCSVRACRCPSARRLAALRRLIYCIPSVGSFTDHFHIGLRGDQCSDALTEQGMVIRQHDPNLSHSVRPIYFKSFLRLKPTRRPQALRARLRSDARAIALAASRRPVSSAAMGNSIEIFVPLLLRLPMPVSPSFFG